MLQVETLFESTEKKIPLIKYIPEMKRVEVRIE